MSAPRKGEEARLKRVLRYLRGRPTTTYEYAWQEAPTHLDGFTDSDWADCRRTRRSTSEGVVMHGGHLVQHYSKTQAGVALSSAEAELNAALKMGCELLGIAEFLKEMKLDLKVRMIGDSSAAKGILSRRGVENQAPRSKAVVASGEGQEREGGVREDSSKTQPW